MTEQQHKEYYAVLTECWRFFLKYGKLEAMQDRQWKQCLEEGTAIAQGHGSTRFCKDLVLAMENEIERIQERTQGGEQHGNKTG